MLDASLRVALNKFNEAIKRIRRHELVTNVTFTWRLSKVFLEIFLLCCSYIVVENLRYLLAQYNPNTAFYFGHRYAAQQVDEGCKLFLLI